MHNPLLLPEIREMLDEGDADGIREILSLHPASVAEFLEGLPAEETWKVLAHANIDRQAEIFTFFPHDKQAALLDGLGRERVSRLLEAMPHDERANLLRQLDSDVVEALLPLVAKADREDIKRLMNFPVGSAGSVMTTDYATLPAAITVSDAIGRLRQQANKSETIYYIYILDDERHLIGFVSLHALIMARPTAIVGEIMQRDIIVVRADQDREETARLLAKFDFLAIPVVDQENHLLGIVTHDDVLDVVVEQQTEDVQRMASVVPIDENYLDAPLVTVWRKRIVWLACLFVAELFTFTALAQYEDAIAHVVALSLFVPLCISTGGNSGSQAATLITRAMALGQVRLTDWFRVLRHELLMGVALGLALGVIGFVRAALTPQSVLGKADRWMLALVIAQSVAVICLWGTIVGSMLPLVFKRIGIDPGYASSPFVATFVDVTGILIYFSIAQGLLL